MVGAHEHRRVKSAERTLGLFEVFASQQRPLTVGEISKLLSMPQPSVTMLVKAMIELGYLEKGARARTYSPTIRIALLGSWINQRFTLDRQLVWQLDRLHAAVAEITYLGIENGPYMLPVVYIRPHASPTRFVIDPYSRHPMTLSAMGKVLLSIKSDRDALALTRRANAEALDSRLRVDVHEFMKGLKEIRALGYAESAGELMPGIKSIAMIMPPLVGHSPMAVAVGGEIERIDAKKQQIVDELRKFVRAFSDKPTSVSPSALAPT